VPSRVALPCAARTESERARAAEEQLKGGGESVLPGPVSPVMAFKPRGSFEGGLSIRATFSTAISAAHCSSKPSP
jgi:hypothetical protein